jgi:hypothetical protein
VICRIEPSPNLQRVFRSLSPLVNSTKLLEDLKQVISLWFTFDGSFKGGNGVFILPDSKKRLSQILRRQRISRTRRFYLLERINRVSILALLSLDQTKQHPRCAVL